MNKKILLVGALTAVMSVGATIGLAACDFKGPDDIKITEGVYDGSYSANGYTQETYFRFYEDGELFSGQSNFYYHVRSYNSNASVFAINPLLGTYEVKDESYTMSAYNNHDDKSSDSVLATELTADKTVILYDLSGNTLFTTGWDTENNRLLGIPADCSFSSATYREYIYANSDKTYTDYGVALYTYYCDTETVRNASLVIYHNNTYADNYVTSNEIVEGTYTVSGSTYTLNAGTGANGGTLVTSSTGATFTPAGGSAITMSTERNREKLDDYVFSGVVTSEDYTAEMQIILYDDNSVDILNNGAVQLSGTWVADDDGNPVYVSITGFSDAYIESDTDEDGVYYTIAINGTTCRTESVAYTVYTFTGTHSMGNFPATLELKNDGTAVYVVEHEQYGGTFEGTWTKEGNEPASVSLANGVLTLTITGSNGAYIAENTDQQITLSTKLYSFTGSAYSGAVQAELVLYANGTCAYILNGNTLTIGTYTTTTISGMAIPASITLEEFEDAIAITPDWTNMQLKANMPATSTGVPAIEVVYNLPTAA